MCEGMTAAMNSRQLMMRSVVGPQRMSILKGGKKMLMKVKPRRLTIMLAGGSGETDWL